MTISRNRRAYLSLFHHSSVILCLCILAAALCGCLGQSSHASISSAQNDANSSELLAAKAIENVGPALVRIHVVFKDSSEGREVKNESAGSGVIVSPDGYVVTNHHVAIRPARLWVTLATREELDADLTGTDPMADIAVLKIRPSEPRQFRFARWGDSSKVRVGDPVFAMGSPLSLSQSITRGMISNTEMIMPSVFGKEKFELDGEDVGSIVRWLGHDAQIFPGNSGGPLANAEGEIIGINEISYGLGGAIPSNLARVCAEQIIQQGEVRRAYSGLLLQPLPKRDHNKKGALAASILPNSPAAQAGIQPGDCLLSINGANVNAHFEEEIPPINLSLASLPIGQAARLRLERGGKEIEVEIAPQTREKVLTPELEFRDWGLTGRNLSLWTQMDLSRDTRDGVLVTSVRAGGGAGAAKPPVEDDDIIIHAGEYAIKNVEDLKKATAAILKDSKPPVPTLVTFERKNQQYLTVVEVGVKDLEDPGKEVGKAWAPVDTQVLTRKLAKALGIPDAMGVRVVQVYRTGDSKDAPFEIGDLILKVDGEPVEASEPHDSEVFAERIRQYRIGTEVEFSILRNGKSETVKMKLPARPLQPREMKRYRSLDFEFIVRELAYMDRQKPGWSDVETPRVIVDSVTEGGWAALGRLKVGDLLLGINGQPVQSIQDVEKLLKECAARKDRYVSMKVRRDTQTLFLEMEPLWPN